MGDRPLILIDGSSYIFRAFHALPPLSSPEGVPTNAVYGFTTMLLKLVKGMTPARCAVVLDAPGPSFRDALYPAYKAQRPKTPDDLIVQIPLIKQIVSALGIPMVEKEGFEADDIIGTLAKRNESGGGRTIIVTGDKDMMQVVSEKTTLLDTMKNRAVGVAEVREKFGVDPERVTDVLALMGDSVDNIPGVPGIGEKTAKRLIREFGSLDVVLSRRQEVMQDRIRAALEKHSKDAEFSRRLVALDLHVPLNVPPEGLAVGTRDRARLEGLFKKLGFLTLLREVPTEAGPSAPRGAYSLVLTEGELAGLISKLRSAGEFALDTETTSPESMRADLVGISFCCREGEAFYIPLAHDYLGVPPQLTKARVLAELAPLLSDPSLKKYGQNIKYDLIVLEKEGITVRGVAGDTMIASYLLDPTRRRHNLSELAFEHLGLRMKEFSDLGPPGKKIKGFQEVPLDKGRDYSCDDAHVTYLLAGMLIPRLGREGLDDLFHTIEMPLVHVLKDMEMAGVRVDTRVLADLSREFTSKLKALADVIYSLAGESFNIESPKQLQEVLFSKLKLPHGKRTKTGFSTDVDVLAVLARDHELPRKVLEYRTFAKLKNTYVDALPGLIHPKTGRIHTSFNQTVTATGRLSSSDPNLQNIPIKGEDGRKIRRAFVPDQGFLYLSADYSQIELRILAHITGDTRLTEAFHKGEDIHSTTAIEVLGASPDLIPHDLRRRAKVVNFGIIYGMSPYGLSQQLEISVEEAGHIIEGYFQKYPGVRGYMDSILKEAREKGYVRTLMQRKRPIPDIMSPNDQGRQAAERTAINTPIQGTAADLIKKAMVSIHRRMKKDFPGTKMILQVHDELVFEAPEGDIEKVTALVREEMEGALALSVPLKVDIVVGTSWAAAH